MTRAQRELVDLNTTSYYHCICRCVRRAFLCGEDHLTGKNFEHRKTWVLERLAMLSRIYAIDVCAYAVMSNHYHLVVRIDQSKARNWTDDQILRRWKALFKLQSRSPRSERNHRTVARTPDGPLLVHA